MRACRILQDLYIERDQKTGPDGGNICILHFFLGEKEENTDFFLSICFRNSLKF